MVLFRDVFSVIGSLRGLDHLGLNFFLVSRLPLDTSGGGVTHVSSQNYIESNIYKILVLRHIKVSSSRRLRYLKRSFYYEQQIK